VSAAGLTKPEHRASTAYNPQIFQVQTESKPDVKTPRKATVSILVEEKGKELCGDANVQREIVSS
jgi:hypothetical protein